MQIIQLLIASSLFASGYALNLSCVLPSGDSWYVSNSLGGRSKRFNRSLVESELNTLKNENDLVKYYLWTKDNPTSPELLILGDPSTLHQSKFDKSNPTRIISHGFKASHKSEACTLIKDAYLKTGPHNVICVDWPKISYKSYFTASCLVPSVGNNVGKFIQFLLKAEGLSKNKLVIVGHSLGAHVVGFAGKYMKKIQNTLPVIVALDAAFPLFPYKDCSSRICKDDADFVESIHTTGRLIGYVRPVGDGAYYPNGGVIQPGCGVDLKGITCAHLRACKYFAEAIEKNGLPTKKCATLANAVSNQCGNKYSSVKMGSIKSYGVKGIFYVPVNSAPPYGMESTSPSIL